MATQLVICVSPYPPVKTGLALPELFSRQVETDTCLNSRPFLPWEATDEVRNSLRIRLDRLMAATTKRTIVDVASYYLPYLADVIALNPTVKIVYLRGEDVDVAETFERYFLSQPLPYNYWIDREVDKWYVDPDAGRSFPKLEMTDRHSAILSFAAICNDMAEAAAAQYPDNVMIVNSANLQNQIGVSGILDFCKYSATTCNVHLHNPDELPWPEPNARLNATNTDSTSSCVVIVPYNGMIDSKTERSLQELEQRGYVVWRRDGISAIDQGRSQLATDALAAGFKELMWIDSDIRFDPESVDRLRSHGLPVVAGVYAKKGTRGLASNFPSGTKVVPFGRIGQLVETEFAATGFLLVRRRVFVEMQRQLKMPACNELFQERIVFPFFLPLVIGHKDASWYLGEDFSFSHRARQCGFSIYSDTSIRLWHVGTYEYGWENAGQDVQRFESYRYLLK